jgi:hypothetical protein
MRGAGTQKAAKSTMLIFICAWATVFIGAAFLGARLQNLPASIPVYRTFLGAPTRLAPKSLISVLRVPMMGAAQLGAVSVLAIEAWRGSDAGWMRFWTGLAVAIAVKTALEAAVLIGLGTRWGATWSPALNAATIAVIVTFLGWAARLWSRGNIGGQLPIAATSGISVLLLLCAHIALATWPLWSAMTPE